MGESISDKEPSTGAVASGTVIPKRSNVLTALEHVVVAAQRGKPWISPTSSYYQSRSRVRFKATHKDRIGRFNRGPVLHSFSFGSTAERRTFASSLRPIKCSSAGKNTYSQGIKWEEVYGRRGLCSSRNKRCRWIRATCSKRGWKMWLRVFTVADLEPKQKKSFREERRLSFFRILNFRL